MGKPKFTDVVSMRLSPEETALLDEVAGIIGVIPKATLLRRAAVIGLETIKADPVRALLTLMTTEAKPKKGKKK